MMLVMSSPVSLRRYQADTIGAGPCVTTQVTLRSSRLFAEPGHDSRSATAIVFGEQPGEGSPRRYASRTVPQDLCACLIVCNELILLMKTVCFPLHVHGFLWYNGRYIKELGNPQS